MKYYVIEEIVEYGSQISKPLCVVEKEEIAKDVVKRYIGLTYFACDTKKKQDSLEKELKLTPLEVLEELKYQCVNYEANIERFDIIETALKSYEVLVEIHANTINSMKLVEKKLKALEIIKEKEVDTMLLFRCFVFDNLYSHPHFEMYNQELYTQNITPQEYNLLKEVLK